MQKVISQLDVSKILFWKAQESAADRAQSIFSTLDFDGLTYSEYIQCFQVHIFLETFILYFIYDFTETVLSRAQCVGLKIKS